ncbi:MAG: M20/M25/M40 family metallo-hydrolase [Candidatus Aminicenantes bacterium]|nr:M20/M25/M40 family metallo-hydrolase [Candidatus Aminicenantes bacterium]
MKKVSFVAFIWLLCSLLIFVQAKDLDQNIRKGLDSIDPMAAYNYVKKMCAPEYAGRHTGHDGYTKAAKWAAQKFKEWGLKTISEKDGYLQPFPAPYVVVRKAEMTFYIHEDQKEQEIKLEVGKDFLPLLYSDSGSSAAEVVFAGWGVSAPDLGYDDYADLDVRGKFVLCFRGVPDRSEKGFQKHDEHRLRMKTAKGKGALGLFYIYEEPIANPNGDWIEGFTPAVISEEAADILFKEKNIKVVDLKADLKKYKRPISFSLPSRAKFVVESQNYPNGVGYNVVGFVKGSDPQLRRECFVIGAHFDHCGQHAGLLFNGADDNASGSAVVMEMAKAFSKLKRKPKRSVVFALFGGEEMGLKGSCHFADHVPKPFEKVDAMFNFDMVAEGDGVSCHYSGQPAEFQQTIKEANENMGVMKASQVYSEPVEGSDHAPFYKKKIPAASFYSTGPHLFYHQTGDTIYRINPDIMADIAKLAFLSAFEWADR